MLKHVPFEKIENFRDLGGYASSYGETSFNVVYRSGTLSDATPADLDKLASLGVKTIIDLRDDKAKKELPDKTMSDPRFVNVLLPVNGNGRVPTSRDDMVASYLEMLEEPYSARRVFQALMHAKKPCVIHCTAGKDRTGSFIMVLLMLNGVPFEEINADYMMSFPLLEALTKRTKTVYPDFPKAVLTPDVSFLRDVEAMFKERYESAEKYCEVIGLNEDEVDLLSNLLGKQEKSCGAVVFHQGKVLIEHMKKGHYSIPKGHVESFDKDELDTARREIKEETGLAVKFIPGFMNVTDYSPKPGVAKRVVFFLAESMSERTVCQPEEVSDIYWLSPADAMRVISHDSDKAVVTAACKWRQENQK